MLRKNILAAGFVATVLTFASAAAVAGSYETPVTHRYCDVEEQQIEGPGKMTRSSNDLEFAYDGGVAQVVGICFQNINIPAGAVVTNAYIQFTAKEDDDSGASALLISGHAEANAEIYPKATFSVTNRPVTAATVAWNPAPWVTQLEAGLNQRTPNIASIVQEIVALPGWQTGNSLSFKVTGTGERTAYSFESGATTSPVLHIDFVGPNPNLAPIVDAGADQELSLPAAALLSATVVDDATPAPAALLWQHVGGSGAGVVSFANATSASTAVTISDDPGTYRLRFTADDGEYSASDELEIAIYAPGITGINLPIWFLTDDAEEAEFSGEMDLHSSDHELVSDGSKGNQTLGFRFQNISVPKGAPITAAYIQFSTDELEDGETNLQIYGQAANNAGTFTNVAFNISNRPKTAASVGWSPQPWNVLLERGPKQQTPDLSYIIQEIVDRANWAPGNSLVLMVEGTGERVAIARNGSLGTVAGGYLPTEYAPTLHIEYAAPGSNRRPTLEAGEDVTLLFPQDTGYLSAAAADDGQPNAELTVLWEHVGGTGTGTVAFGDPASLDTPFTITQEIGTYVLRVTIDDGEYTATDELTVHTYVAGAVTGMTLVNHTHTGFDGLGNPLAVPAIDPAGVLYHEPSDTLFIADSEINEVEEAFNIVQANIFITNPTVTSTLNQFDATVRQSFEPSRNREPTGITYCASDNHFYMTNDDARLVYRYSYDGLDFTLVDWTDVNSYTYDPEGITCDPSTGRLYVTGGASVHMVVLDYATSFNYVDTIDLAITAGDPNGVPLDGEGIAFDPGTGHLFIVSSPDEALFEFTKSGSFVQKLSYAGFSTVPDAAQGLSVGRSSANPLKTSFYIADGMTDNDSDPNERDGQIFEAEILRAE